MAFHDARAGKDRAFAGSIRRVTFGSEQYQWHPNGKEGSADPDGPPAVSQVKARAGTTFTLPKASVTVLRGRVR